MRRLVVLRGAGRPSRLDYGLRGHSRSRFGLNGRQCSWSLPMQIRHHDGSLALLAIELLSGEVFFYRVLCPALTPEVDCHRNSPMRMVGRENALWARAKTGCLTAESIAESAFRMVAESGAAVASSLHPQMGWWGCAIPPENRAMGGALGKVGRQPAWARRSRQRTALLNSDYPLRKVSEFRGLPFQKLNSTGEPQYGISASLSFDIR